MGEWNISLAKTGWRLPQAVMTTHVLPYKSKRELEANLLNQKRQVAKKQHEGVSRLTYSLQRKERLVVKRSA